MVNIKKYIWKIPSNSQLQSKHKQKLERWLVNLEFTRENNQNKIRNTLILKVTFLNYFDLLILQYLRKVKNRWLMP